MASTFPVLAAIWNGVLRWCGSGIETSCNWVPTKCFKRTYMFIGCTHAMAHKCSQISLRTHIYLQESILHLYTHAQVHTNTQQTTHDMTCTKFVLQFNLKYIHVSLLGCPVHKWLAILVFGVYVTPLIEESLHSLSLAQYD